MQCLWIQKTIHINDIISISKREKLIQATVKTQQ